MKIALINTSDINGGAGKSTCNLHKGLRKIGQESQYLVLRKSSRDKNTEEAVLPDDMLRIEGEIFKRIRQKEIIENRSSLSDTHFCFPYPGIDLSSTRSIKQAEVINLHWVSGFQSVETAGKLMNLNVPVVWTLHDQGPFTGGCHYAAGCEKYKESCTDCPQLENDRFLLPHIFLKNKINTWNLPNLTVVAQSQWLAECARKSRVFRECRVETIPAAIDCTRFYPVNKKKSRKTLGLKENSLVFLFGAANLDKKRKGFDLTLEILEKLCRLLKKSGNNVCNIELMVFGYGGTEISTAPVPVRHMGFVREPRMLRQIYSAADLTFVTSREDNLPRTMRESLACGTPVAGFAVGGMKDMIFRYRTGILAEPFNTDSLVADVSKMMNSSELRKRMSAFCSDFIKKNCSVQSEAGRYLTLFEEVLAEMGSKNKFPSDIQITEPISQAILPDFFSVYRKHCLEVMDEAGFYIS